MLKLRLLAKFTLMAVLASPFAHVLVAQQQTPGAPNTTDTELDDATARKLVRGCSLPHQVKGSGPAGSQIVLQFTVSEKGKLLGVHRVQGAFTRELAAAFADCHFAPYKVNGTATSFHADVVIDVK